MKDADINYITVDSFGRFVLKDTFSFGHGKPKDDKDLGGTFDFDNIRSFIKDGFVNIIFEREFDTNDKFDKKLQPVKFNFYNVFHNKILGCFDKCNICFW